MPCEAMNTCPELERIKALEEALRWYVETDETMEGGTWEQENAYYLQGKRNAMKLLGMEPDPNTTFIVM